MPKIALKEYIGELVEIEFDDHAWSDKIEIVKCRVWGKLIKVQATRIVLLVWDTMNFKDNDEFAVLVRSTITAVHRLKRVK